MFSTEYIYHSIKDLKSVGVIENDLGYVEVAEPVGIVAGITPLPILLLPHVQILICAKTRNLIFAFHPSAQKYQLKLPASERCRY